MAKSSYIVFTTKQELLDIAFSGHDYSEDFIRQHNPDLFNKNIRLFVPVGDNLKQILDGVGFHDENSLMVFKDKVIVNFNTIVHIELCAIDEEQSLVLSLTPPSKGYNGIKALIDVMDTPRYSGKPITHYSKTLDLPLEFADGAEEELEKAWNDNYVPMLNVVSSSQS